MATLESDIPHIIQHLEGPHMNNATRTMIRRVKDILSNVRWDYGPHSHIGSFPADGPIPGIDEDPTEEAAE